MREVDLARNCCLHNGGVPTNDYNQQTKQRLLDGIGIINLAPKQLDEVIEALQQFVDSVFRRMSVILKEAPPVPPARGTSWISGVMELLSYSLEHIS